jgi:hypothetical protein
MLETEASRERWTVRFDLIAILISVGALLFTFLQWRSSERAVDVAEHARRDAVAEAERQRIDAKSTLDQQRKDATEELQAQTQRADRANVLADRSANAARQSASTAAAQLEDNGFTYNDTFALKDDTFKAKASVKNFDAAIPNVLGVPGNFDLLLEGKILGDKIEGTGALATHPEAKIVVRLEKVVGLAQTLAA